MRTRDRARPLAEAYRDTFEGQERKGRLADHLPMLCGGVVLVAAFAFAGNYMGQNADAHNVDQASLVPDFVTPAAIVSPAPVGNSKAALDLSLLPKGALLDPAPELLLRQQEVASFGKGDPVEIEVETIEPEPPVPEARPMAKSPPIWKLETSFRLKRREKQKVIAQRRVRVAEENCLARAIYFEARSESEMGQLAVAKVILNRLKSPDYPKTICGVVYQGSDRRNSCQFSFACDGMPDEIRSKSAWERSRQVAQKALAGDHSVKVMGAATNYHADYVKPRWSRNMKRLVKIGRHIFYSDT